MLGKLLGQSEVPIGCAFERRSVVITQLCVSPSGRLTCLTESREVATNTSDRHKWSHDAVQALRSAWAEGEFIGRDVVSCLPTELVTFSRLRLPPMPETELSAAVQWQAAKKLSRPPNELRTAYYDVGEFREANKRFREVLAVVVDLADVESHAAMLRKAGLSPVAIDTRQGAVARCVNSPDFVEGGSAPVLVIDAAIERTDVMAVRDGLPYFVHSVPTGLAHIAERARTEAGGLVDEQALLAGMLGHGITADASSCLLEVDQATDQEHAVVDHACVLYAKEVAKEVELCRHYLSDLGALDLQPRHGCLVGGDSFKGLITRSLSKAASLRIEPLAASWTPAFRSLAIASVDARTLDSRLASLGLAFYGMENLSGRTAA
jgi:hypothetical protein